MKVLVTGGAGFVGTNLIKKLLELGHEVYSIDNYETGTTKNHQPGCTYYDVDVNDIQYEDLTNTKFDLIYHLAGLSRIQPSFKNPRETFIANTCGTEAICEYARLTGAKLIYAGSSSKHHNPYQSPYATYKYLGEELCKMYRLTYNMDIDIVRFYNVYGPYEFVDSDWAAVIGIWRRQTRDQLPLTIVGDGEQRRDFTHVIDIVDALIRLIDNTFKVDDAWELGAGQNYSINQVASWFVKYAGATVKHVPDQPGNYRETIRETDIALDQLGWEPQDRLEEYIKSLY